MEEVMKYFKWKEECGRTEESSGGQDGNDERLLTGGDGKTCRTLGRRMTKSAQPVFHFFYSTDGSGVITTVYKTRSEWDR